MRRLALLLLLAILSGMPVACGSGDANWEATARTVEQYLTFVSTGRYAEAHALYDMASPVYGKPESADDFIAAMKQQNELWPGLMKFNWRLERLEGSTRTRLYRYKIYLTWPDGYPAERNKAVRTADGQELLPVLGPEMSINVIQRHGKWGIQVVSLYWEAPDLFAGKPPAPVDPEPAKPKPTEPYPEPTDPQPAVPPPAEPVPAEPMPTEPGAGG